MKKISLALSAGILAFSGAFAEPKAAESELNDTFTSMKISNNTDSNSDLFITHDDGRSCLYYIWWATYVPMLHH